MILIPIWSWIPSTEKEDMLNHGFVNRLCIQGEDEYLLLIEPLGSFIGDRSSNRRTARGKGEYLLPCHLFSGKGLELRLSI